MSQASQPEVLAAEAPAPGNTVGTVGLVLSIVAFLTLGLLSPIAFIVSLVGVFKPPRVLAAIGLALSAVGCLLLLAVCVVAAFITYRYQEERDFQRVMQQQAVQRHEEAQRALREMDAEEIPQEREFLLPAPPAPVP